MKLEEDFSPFKGAILYDNSWPSFIDTINQLSPQSSFDDVCNAVGLNPASVNNTVDNAVRYWRDSTQTSLFHGISYLSLGKSPKPENAIFVDLLWQTRFITMAQKLRMISILDIEIVPTKNPIIGNEKAKTVTSKTAVNKINLTIKLLYIYWWMNSKKKIRLPKIIYRGIRAGNLYGHPTLKPAIDAIWTTDLSHKMKRKKAVDILIDWICQKKLHQITDGNILSFTSSIPTAKYFSNGEGFILCVDPSKVEIITSEIHDPDRVGGRDPMSNRMEKEYIVKIPPNYEFTKDNIIINDLDYLIAEENPLCVELFDHDDKSANYEMYGTPILVTYRWKTNEKGVLEFMVTDNGSFSYSRKEFKEIYGFDPMPTEKNLSEITNFKFKEVKRRW